MNNFRSLSGGAEVSSRSGFRRVAFGNHFEVIFGIHLGSLGATMVAGGASEAASRGGQILTLLFGANY